MAFKTLTIKKSVYQKLFAMKKENESFSELFDRLSRKNIDTLKKLRGVVDLKDKDLIIKEIYKKREEKRYG
jgi:predicted CopG family antitoxin